MIIIFLFTTLHLWKRYRRDITPKGLFRLDFIVLCLSLQITYHFQSNDHSHLCPPGKKCCLMDNRTGGTRGSIVAHILLELEAKPV